MTAWRSVLLERSDRTIGGVSGVTCRGYKERRMNALFFFFFPIPSAPKDSLFWCNFAAELFLCARRWGRWEEVVEGWEGRAPTTRSWLVVVVVLRWLRNCEVSMCGASSSRHTSTGTYNLTVNSTRFSLTFASTVMFISLTARDLEGQNSNWQILNTRINKGISKIRYILFIFVGATNYF